MQKVNFMGRPWEKIINSLANAISIAYNISTDDVIRTISKPPSHETADIAINTAFMIASKLKRNPREIAEELKSVLVKNEYVQDIEVAPPAFLNIKLSTMRLAKETITGILAEGEKYGTQKIFSSKKVIIEFPAVNPSKPLHIGHVRNAVLGDTLARVFDALGANTIRMDYINDLGLQVAKIIWKLWEGNIDNISKEKKFDHFLGELYVSAEKELEREPEKEKEVRLILKKLEEGEEKITDFANKITERCVKEQYKTQYALNIFHDVQVWESDLAHSGLLLKGISTVLQYENIIKLDSGPKAGCIVAKMDYFDEFKKLKDPYKVLVRSDGTATYTGKDTVFQLWKFGLIENPFVYRIFEIQPNGKELWRTTISSNGVKLEFNKGDIIINVIGIEQAHPQRLIYLILKLMGFFEQYDNSHHLAYDHVVLPEGKFSGRKGTWIGYTADDLINEAIIKAKQEIEKRNPKMDEKMKENIAKIVGIGAIRYTLLKQSPEKKIIFTWEDALNFDGYAAPYVQYSYARATRILEKSNTDINIKNITNELFNQFKTEWEHDLILLLSKFPSILVDIIKNMRKEIWGTKIELNKIPQYAYDVSVAFNKFYQKCPVLSADSNELKIARLSLVKATQIVLKNVLNIMGIEAPERM